MTRNSSSALLTAVLLVLVVASGCRSLGDAARGNDADGATVSAVGDGLDQLDQRLDEVLARYGEPVTDDRRRLALAFLTELTSATDGCETCDELEVLVRILELPANQGQLSFEDAARFAVAELLRENLYEDRS